MGSELYNNRWLVYLGNKDSKGTIALINDSGFDDVPILCKNGYSGHIKYLANGEGVTIPDPIEARDAAKYIKKNGIEAVYVDDARGVLEDLLGCRVNGVSIELSASEDRYGDDEYNILTLYDESLEFVKNDPVE